MKQLKILMTTMGLGIGGAETHILELSKQLVREGHSVCVCSNGGVYVEELTKMGIRHYGAPMHRRSVLSMLASFFTLLGVMIKEKPDVVHSHARIPALLSSIACKLTGTPMITTVHFNFKTGGGLKFITRWGEKSIAVSEDLKQYLVENYGIPAENISLTINGIDTALFSPAADGSAIRREFGFTGRNRLIVTVSRMDKNACFAVYELLKCADRLYADNPDYRIVVVGGGDALEELTDIVHTINDRLSCPFVTLTGGRTDISAFCAAADLFVGVSRSALEAMSAGKAVVLAGNQGSLGLFTADKTEAAFPTNFTCRGLTPTTDTMLYTEITRFFSIPKEETDSIRHYGRQFVSENYSVKKMAGDALKVYYSVVSRKKYDLLLCGYYGYHNAGDEALLKTIIHNLHELRPELRIAVLTKGRLTLSKTFPVSPVKRFNPFSLLYAIANSSMMVFGGGNLIQDETSTKSLFYYLTLLRTAKFFGLKTMLYANGIGPVSGASNLKKAAAVLNCMDVITLREPQSYNLLHTMGVTKPDISVTADEVFTAIHSVFAAGAPKIDLPAKKYIVVSLRQWKTSDPKLETKLAGFLDSLVDQYGVELVFLPMQDQGDGAVCTKVRSILRSNSRIYGHLSMEEILYVISKSSLLLGMRLHSLIFATGCCVPAIGIVYDPKIDGFLNYIGVNRFVKCESIQVDKLKAYVKEIFDNQEKTAATLKAAADMQIRAAQRNAHIAIELLESDKNA